MEWKCSSWGSYGHLKHRGVFWGHPVQFCCSDVTKCSFFFTFCRRETFHMWLLRQKICKIRREEKTRQSSRQVPVQEGLEHRKFQWPGGQMMDDPGEHWHHPHHHGHLSPGCYLVRFFFSHNSSKNQMRAHVPCSKDWIKVKSLQLKMCSDPKYICSNKPLS